MEIHWAAPLHGDDANPGADRPARPATIEYLSSLFSLCEQMQFDGLLIGAGYRERLEAWTVASSVLSKTNSIRAIVATRPGMFHPCILAKIAATVDQISSGRVILNVVTGGDPSEHAMYGDLLDHDERYARTDEFIKILKVLWGSDHPSTFQGRFYQFEESLLLDKPRQRSGPPIYFGGSSLPAQKVAAANADAYLMFGEGFDATRQRIAAMGNLTSDRDSELRFGLRLNVVARSTRESAWETVSNMEASFSQEAKTRLGDWYRRSDSQAAHRIRVLGDESRVIDERLWTGLSKVRVGAGTALVGSYEDVAAALHLYSSMGISIFILSGFPHLEEAMRFGEEVLPKLQRAN
jgi:alkanesulfonate monooxygenase